MSLVFLTLYHDEQGRSQNLELGEAALLLVMCSDFGFGLCCYLVANCLKFFKGPYCLFLVKLVD